MPREFKFRIWDNLYKQWLKKKVYHSGIRCNEDGIGQFSYLQHDHGVTISQYTGLKDKNGKGIFEGDILQCPWGFSNEHFSVGEVVFWDGAFYLSKGEEKEWPDIIPFNLYSFNDTPTRRELWRDATIIGNRYENPELLCNGAAIDTMGKRAVNVNMSVPIERGVKTCPKCNNTVVMDGNIGHLYGCDYVWGKRGWRQLGEYDG